MEHRTVTRTAAAEMMTLDEPGKPTPLAGSNHVNQFVCPENVDHHFVAGIRSIITLQRNFTDEPYRCSIVLFEVAGHRLIHALWFHKLDEAELHGVITVLLLCLFLNDNAGAGL